MEEMTERFDAFMSPAEGFVVDDLAKANWCLKKIKEVELSKAKMEAFVRDEREKLENFYNQEMETYDNTIESFKMKLIPFVEKELANSKKKSIKLPEGTLGFRALPPKIERNDEVFNEYMKANHTEYVKFKPIINWADFKKTLAFADDKMVSAEGEIVPGVKVSKLEPQFYVKVGE